ncbi:MAG: hypothetical protein A2Y17_10140 [Clostridiales bacterium GWF2_38_85]|nr:MAG: hypothetical protein A2Y17_10140 [Clostridiales bacterium GWF2_38_85]HBL84475.1 hypothetical protein [Clostridiales bacterium]
MQNKINNGMNNNMQNGNNGTTPPTRPPVTRTPTIPPTMPPTTPQRPGMPMPQQPGMPMPIEPGNGSAVYPEIYYRILPYILLACDRLDSTGAMPDQDMIDRMTEEIYRDLLEMNPDLEEYARGLEDQTSPTMAQAISRNPYYYGRRYRRRGGLRDIIDILFLSEFYRRRRRPYYWY